MDELRTVNLAHKSLENAEAGVMTIKDYSK